jgi:glycolate oxidase
MFGVKAFDTKSYQGKVIPTLQRCAEYGKMLVRGGRLSFPELPRF